ncbi:MAG: helix-turn-helix domain containing protein [Pyrinomonadaceae bacterium]|jgi:hypothetical protein|nr:helix-turn-helix domain containing protein [Pyrinomonadaceae bacterium]
MSSKNSTVVENIEFRDRLVSVLGTNKPADVQRLLNISYQAAKNYLLGRIPDSQVLITIAERTGVSINWLLTGKGQQFIKTHQVQNDIENTSLIKDIESGDVDGVLFQLGTFDDAISSEDEDGLTMLEVIYHEVLKRMKRRQLKIKKDKKDVEDL